MERQPETCPWCQRTVWVEQGQRRLFTCPSCGETVTFTTDATRLASRSSGDPVNEATGPDLPAAQPADGETFAPAEFVETPFISGLVECTLAYLQEGLAVHLTGPAGSGKTTLALNAEHEQGRPVVLIHGDDQMGTADLVGKESGYQHSYTRDQFIHTVLKLDEQLKPLWVARALSEACEKGYTVVYDEFTASRPEAINVLLSVLEERVLPLKGSHISVHPEFRVILTSNSAEYAGVHGALLDRMVTIQMENMDEVTEVAIARARSGLAAAAVERVVVLVRAFRGTMAGAGVSSIRSSIMIARILRVRGGRAHAEDPVFVQTCRDVLLAEARRTGLDQSDNRQLEVSLSQSISDLCSAPLPQEYPALDSVSSGQGSEPWLTELMQDEEVEALLLRKIRDKGLVKG